MKLEDVIIKRYNNPEKIGKGYYLRVRENGEKTEIKVYYGGIKIYEVYDSKFILNSAIFIPNSKNVFENMLDSEEKTDYSKIKYRFIDKFKEIPQNVSDDMEIIDQIFTFNIGSRLKVSKETRYKIDLEFTDTAMQADEEELARLVALLQEDFETYKELFSSIELGPVIHETEDGELTKRRRILVFLKSDKADQKDFKLSELYHILIWLLNGVLCKWKKGDNRYFKSPDLNITPKLRNDIHLDFDVLENILERRVNVYTGGKKDDPNYDKEADYNKTKLDDNQEKQYQQKFMEKLSMSNKGKTYYIDQQGQEKELYSENLYPFELEYVIYAGKPKGYEEDDSSTDETRSRSNVKGRIDNTFIDGNTGIFVEIKYGDGVIGKSNGLHKHLIDLYSCLRSSKEVIMEEYIERVNIRRKKMPLMDDKNQNMEIDHLRYDIVCIFNSTVKEESGLSKQSVMNRINEIYLADAKGAGIKRSKLKLCKCNDDNICSNANYYCRNLLMKNIPELISLVEEYCEVRIILVDECFNKFEEYIPKK